MTKLLRNGSTILFWLAVMTLVGSIYQRLSLGPIADYAGGEYRSGAERAGVLFEAVVNGLWMSALPFFGSCILYQIERLKGRGE